MTIYDIARIAGVSKSTVSRVINNDSSVKEATRINVQNVIKKYNFRPNKSAKALNSAPRKTILVIVTSLDSYYENRVLRGMIEEDNNESDFIVMECKHSYENTKDIISNYSHVDAIIIFSLSGYEYEFLENSTIPCVVVGHNIPALHSVYYDDEQAVKLLFDELVKKDTKRILYFGFQDSNTRMGKLRNDTMRKLCKENDKELVILYVNESSDSKLLLSVMQKIDDFDLILCAQDEMALYVYIHTLGEKQIAGMGNNVKLMHYFTEYTTVSFGYKDSGKKIIKKLNANNLNTFKMDAKLINLKY